MSSTINFEKEVQQFLEKEQKKQQRKHDNNPRENPFKFSPSQVGCPRQTYLRKCNALEPPLGIFKVGSMIHELMEDKLKPKLAPEVKFEQSCSIERKGIKFSGRFDCLDTENNILYDFKSMNSFYNFHKKRHKPGYIDQLTIYMGATGTPKSKLVYISKNDLQVREYPSDGFIRFDPERMNEIIKRCQDVGSMILVNGPPKLESNIPYPKCDCMGCQYETLDL